MFDENNGVDIPQDNVSNNEAPVYDNVPPQYIPNGYYAPQKKPKRFSTLAIVITCLMIGVMFGLTMFFSVAIAKEPAREPNVYEQNKLLQTEAA